MNRYFTTLTLAAALAAPATADDAQTRAESAKAAPAAAELKVPVSVHGFSGEIVGTVVSKNTDGASLVLKVQQVPRVWKNNKAEKPQDLVGRTVPVERFFGRFLDVLLVVKPGDTVLLEAKHVRGDQLQFLGEVFKKVEPVSELQAETAKDQPAGADADKRKFPEGLEGFRGIFVGKVVKTDVENGVLLFEAESVKNVWPQNKAKNPANSKGKILKVNGIAGKWLDVLLVLKPGDRIEVEAFHNRGEALDFVQEWLKKVD